MKEGGIVEPNRSEIEDRMRRMGYTEKEAEAAYHLWRAKELFEELYSPPEDSATKFVSRLYNDMHFGVHFGALTSLLGRRVLRRDYPDGWGPASEPED